MSTTVWNTTERKHLPRELTAWRVEYARWKPGGKARFEADNNLDLDRLVTWESHYHHGYGGSGEGNAIAHAEKLARSKAGPWHLARITECAQVETSSGVCEWADITEPEDVA